MKSYVLLAELPFFFALVNLEALKYSDLQLKTNYEAIPLSTGVDKKLAENLRAIH